MFDSVIREDGDVYWVTLSLQEMVQGATVGAMRRHAAEMDNRRPAHEFDDDKDSAFGIHVDGAVAEIAAAKVLDRYFEGRVNNFKSADIGKIVQVRHTISHKNCLLFRPNGKTPDDPNHVFILVTGSAPKLCVRGWLWGHECQKLGDKRAPNGRPPAWFVAQEHLRKVKRK